MQVGIDSFAAAHDDASLSVSPSERLRRLVEQIEFADQLGLDVFGVGEHHRQEFLDSAPVVILGDESSAFCYLGISITSQRIYYSKRSFRSIKRFQHNVH